MIEGLNSLSSLSSINSASLQSRVSVDDPDFMDNLSEVFERATKNLQKVPGMDGVYISPPLASLDITVIDPV